MTGTLTEPHPEEPVWCHGRAECLTCEHLWTAVWPVDAGNLECPYCGSTDTIREAE
jgi:uncharacterized Zn-finger protein